MCGLCCRHCRSPIARYRLAVLRCSIAYCLPFPAHVSQAWRSVSWNKFQAVRRTHFRFEATTADDSEIRSDLTWEKTILGEAKSVICVSRLQIMYTSLVLKFLGGAATGFLSPVYHGPSRRILACHHDYASPIPSRSRVPMNAHVFVVIPAIGLQNAAQRSSWCS